MTVGLDSSLEHSSSYSAHSHLLTSSFNRFNAASRSSLLLSFSSSELVCSKVTSLIL